MPMQRINTVAAQMSSFHGWRLRHNPVQRNVEQIGKDQVSSSKT